MNFTVSPEALAGWTVICLRPARQQASARRATQARGGQHLSLPGLRLVALPATAALAQALACPSVVFTSPAAVHFAAQQQALRLAPGIQAVAVGEGSARALARHGIQAHRPAADAMNSEGVLDLPLWQQASGPVGLVTAPGGRGIIAAGLVRRGFKLVRAEVYQRLSPRLDTRHFTALRQSRPPRAVLVTSAEALDAVIAALTPDTFEVLRASVAVVSSPRLAHLARSHHFATVLTAPAPTVAALLDTLAQYVATTRFR